MQLSSDRVLLRKPEPQDAQFIYAQKNNPEVANGLLGFSLGYSMADISDWIEFHRTAKDEVVWVIADRQSDQCLGHVGLYQIDHRIRWAELGIMIGAKNWWNKGIGTECVHLVCQHGFDYLNLNRISLRVLQNNARALAVYRKVGFREEGILRQAQYKAGQYIDVVIMALLRDEYTKPKV